MKKPQQDSFADLMGDVKPIKQDKHYFKPQAREKRRIDEKPVRQPQDIFSDTFEAHFDDTGPLRFVRDGADPYEVKKLRRGDYDPELLLDLHGLRQHQAKHEILALLETAKREHVHCCCISHGVSGGVLRQKVPNWLVQHPDVVAFHQAPLQWGGDGSVLVLIDIEEER
ncbi:endonuclease SmrB [Paraferrimonas sedimenticola]|uniref:Ribosome rescue factor SmrB n=1 Tax=Paraferrimonas sedimenticola TaxID=375674 RepID=A0AA37RWN7_9GAMM|nr:endonuclease SmrB [Paraferrimonas sedimenticola]GLP96588.1 UPF0115 protein [Paraferrimonas sedimenticola]